MIIKKAYPGSLYDVRGVEKWLEAQAAAGLRLEKFGASGDVAKFYQEAPRRIRCYAEPDFDQFTPEEMEKAYREKGWKFVCEVRGSILLYETEDLLATKPAPMKPTEEQLRNKSFSLWGNALAWIIGIPLLVGKPVMSILQAASGGEMNLLAAAYIAVATILLLIVEIFVGIGMFYDIYIWRKVFRWEESVVQQPAMAIFRRIRRRGMWILFGGVAVILILCLIHLAN